MATIRAVISAGPDLPLSLESRPRPALFPDGVRIRIAAVGVNRADLLQRRGRYPAPHGTPEDVLGLEYAGTVVEAGAAVPPVPWAKAGAPVMGLVPGGAMAEELVVHHREVLPVPSQVAFDEAAAIPEAFATAYDGMVVQGDLAMGEAVLIHAAASGVGTAAIQLACAIGARPVGTSRSPAKLERCRALGLRHAVVPEEGRFADAVTEAVGAVALVFDPIGAAYLEENFRALAPKGRYVLYGLLGGAKVTVPLAQLLSRRFRMQGTVLRSRPAEERMALSEAMRAKVLPLFEDGTLRPVVDEVLPMSDAEVAHKRLENNETVGKLLLRW